MLGDKKKKLRYVSISSYILWEYKKKKKKLITIFLSYLI